MSKFHKLHVFLSHVITSFSQDVNADFGSLPIPQGKSTYRLRSMKDILISFIAPDADVEPGNF